MVSRTVGLGSGSRRRPARAGWSSALVAVVAVTLASGGWLSGASATTARPASAGKSAAYARAHATGFGLRGGHGSGRAVGRSTVTRTAKPRALTSTELAQQRRAGLMPDLAPSNGGSTPNRATGPTSKATSGAARAASGARPAAGTDFNYFRASNISPGNYNSGTNEPSVANDGNVVLTTGNWYAAESTDAGHSFTYVNPYSLGPTPSLPNGGFCCDQVAIHAQTGITAWGLLYCPTTCGASPSGNNLIRLAVARNKTDLASSTFDYYDFSAQTFGFPDQDWLDYPHFGVNANSLLLTMNVFNGGSVVAMIMVRFDLSSFASGGWSANWVNANQDFTWTPTDNSTDTWAYWGATQYNNGGLIRVYNWPPGTDYTHVSWNDFGASFNYEWKNGTCTAPDGKNWCNFDDSRVKTGGEIGSSTVYFMWDAKQGGGFAYPYVNYASFDVSTGPATSFSQSQVWNSNYTWAYPGLGIDGRGHLGVSIQIGGGTWGYPGSQFLIADDVSGGFAAAGLDSGAHSNTRWGDYLTARAATTGGTIGNTWIAVGYTLHDDGSGGTVVYPSFYWLGRNRDDPFAPSWYYNYANNFTEGVSYGPFTGIFVGPSNCTCDYYAYNYWGDGGSNTASLYNYLPTLFALYGDHTYAEEGNYTTSMYAYDYFGFSASGNGSSAVADASLSGSKKNFSAAVGVSFTKVVARFTDADPSGTASDYSASINWGDGATTTGTISGFNVKGTHAYATTGPYTITTTISDVGGASVSVNTKANIGYLPTITSVTPTSGTHNGGTTVVINGAHFTGATSVTFGTTPAATMTVNSDTKITVKSPSHATGLVNVRVTTKFGTSAVTNADRFTFT